ncbi:MAG: PIN domain-containing protein [Gammaproteobacteria bacterium]|nr:PIN domain-containing protein [Gammaproteobacteria bacterium]
MMTVATRLRQTLVRMTDRLGALVRDVPVSYFERETDVVVIIAPEYYWGERTVRQVAQLQAIKRDYEEWIEGLHSVFRSASNEVRAEIERADGLYRMWLEFDQNWSLGQDPNDNEARFRNDASRFDRLVDILDSAPRVGVIVIPDTNSIVEHPDPNDYGVVAGSDRFTVVLLPTVLSELDELKTLHRNPEFRDKAKKTIARIKGWRMQGSLRDGVAVNGTITVRAVPRDPKMHDSLSWLDPTIEDDRIIASVLEVQAANPSDRVVLVTGDINLLNKAEAAGVDHAEI